MKATTWVGPSIFLAALIATQAFRIVGVAQTDPEAATGEAGIAVGVLAIFALVVAGIYLVRSGDRVKRRRALGGMWIDDVTISPLEALRGGEPGGEMPRDFALGIDDGALKVWATVGGKPLLSIAGSSIRSVEMIEIPVSSYASTYVERSVDVVTDDGVISFSPSAVLGYAPPRRDAILIANRIRDLTPFDLRPAPFE